MTFTMSSMREYLKVQSSLIDSFFKMSCKDWEQKPSVTMAIRKIIRNHPHIGILTTIILLDTLILFINPKPPSLKTHILAPADSL